MAKRRKDRAIALMFALVFAGSTIGLTAMAIIADRQTNDAASEVDTTQTGGENMLQGTQLEDFTPITSVNELQTIDTVPGDGTEVKAGDTVTVDYTGAVAATGTIFQSSKDTGQPATFGLDQVIKGWTDGIPGMKIGGTRRLIIPAEQAYGANPPQNSGIPANAPLVFDVTLQAIGD